MLPLDFFRPKTSQFPTIALHGFWSWTSACRDEGLELQRLLAVENVQTPIILITAHGEQEVSAAEVRGGTVALLRQPFSQESLLAALRSALPLQGPASP
jgi:CheY-like chemotaxis protein